MSVARSSRPSVATAGRRRVRLLVGSLVLALAGSALLSSPAAARPGAPAAAVDGAAAADAPAGPAPVRLLEQVVPSVVTAGEKVWIAASYFSDDADVWSPTGTVEAVLGGEVVGSFSLKGSFAGPITIPASPPLGGQVLTLRYLGSELHAPLSTDFPVVVRMGGFVSRTPERLVDRLSDGTDCEHVRYWADLPLEATGVTLNVTAAGATGPGYVVVYPDTADGSTPVPAGSTVNFEPGADVANSAYVEVPENGRICWTTAGAPWVRILIDVTGYTTAASGLTALPSTRVLDTRPGGAGDIDGLLVGGRAYELALPEDAGVPSDATAVLVNATVTGTTAVGNLRVYPGDQLVPAPTSVLNYAPGRDKANATLVSLDGGTIRLYSDSPGVAHVVLDVIGYTRPGSVVVAQRPERVLDTRRPTSAGGSLQPRTAFSLDLGDEIDPVRTTAVVLNVTAVGASGPGNLRVYPDTDGDGQTPPPDASSLNYITGRDVPNQVVVGIPENGRIMFWSDTFGGDVDVVVDLVGQVLD